MFKEQKGITLVALVITIIVLLILAGVSISLVMGQNGVLGKAGQAVDATELGSIRDEINNALASIQTEYYADMATGSGASLESVFKAKEKVGTGTTEEDYGKFKNQFNDKVKIEVTPGTEAGKYTITYIKNPDNATDKKEFTCGITIESRTISITTDVAVKSTTGTTTNTTNP